MLPHKFPLMCHNVLMSFLQDTYSSLSTGSAVKVPFKNPQPYTNILIAVTLKQLHDKYQLFSHIEQEVW
jgi:hypothetical protein